jgi:site-specific recombinase XerD
MLFNFDGAMAAKTTKPALPKPKSRRKPGWVALHLDARQLQEVESHGHLARMMQDMQAFGDYLIAERGFSPRTRTAYLGDLSLFLHYLASQGCDFPAQKVAKDLVSAYVRHLRTKEGLQASSANRRIAAIRHFWRWMLETGIIEADPLSALRTAKIGKKLPRPLSEDEVQRLLDAVKPIPSARGAQDAKYLEIEAARNRAFLELLYGSGLRISEACGLQWGDLDLGNSQGPLARVRGKGKKQRVVPLSRAFLACLLDYLRMASYKPGAKQPLFLARHGGPLSAPYMDGVFKKLLAQAGLPSDLTPHKLRHSFATHMLDHGADTRIIQELLGHESLATTQIYTQVSRTKAQQTWQETHPRDKMGI